MGGFVDFVMRFGGLVLDAIELVSDLIDFARKPLRAKLIAIGITLLIVLSTVIFVVLAIRAVW